MSTIVVYRSFVANPTLLQLHESMALNYGENGNESKPITVRRQPPDDDDPGWPLMDREAFLAHVDANVQSSSQANCCTLD